IAEKKIEFGHWEGDLVLGYKGIDNALTLVEMSTGFLLATNCKNRKMDTVSKAINTTFRRLPKELIKTLTLDRGSEFSGYKAVQKSLGCKVYFCHPQTPNERALNEQTNGLLRQFYPKRKRSVFSDPERLASSVDLINHRPRKKFGYRTTWEIIEEQGLAGVLSLV
ncbi:IS30 family transposase, partial [Pseudodesulfovibrio sp. JC047]|uniref:IS30 family transposase n=1 Tax=Pseudodesulfovibrio sp. JC047 TaxID=2683199 RepID=UPI0013D575C4